MVEYYKTIEKKSGDGKAFFIANAEDDYLHLRCIESDLDNFKKDAYYYITKDNVGKTISGHVLTLCDDSEQLLLNIKTNGGKDV